MTVPSRSLCRAGNLALLLLLASLCAGAQSASQPVPNAGPATSIAVLPAAVLPATALPDAPSASLGILFSNADAPQKSDSAAAHVQPQMAAAPVMNVAALAPLFGKQPFGGVSGNAVSTSAPEPGFSLFEDQNGTGEPQKASPANRAGQQPKRILGLMPNYRSVSSGVTPPRPTLKGNFTIATRQAFDYSAFIFLTITSAAAYAQDSHPSLDTYNGGDAVFWAYIWRGFVDKTDGNYLAAFILPTLLREDTRYFAMGTGSKWKRLGYAASRVAVARTYGGHDIPNIAGLGGKVAAQAISPYYYPPGSSTFGVLATKFAYSVARDMGFTVFREFWPDIAIHVLHRNP